MHLFCIGLRPLGNWPYHSFMESSEKVMEPCLACWPALDAALMGFIMQS